MADHPRGQGLQIVAAQSPPGPAFLALLLDDERSRAEAVSALLSQLDGPATRVLRLDARLRSLLTLEGGADALARVLAERKGRETLVFLLIEHAETLSPQMLRSLQALAPYFVQPGRPALRVAFVGRPAFRALLAGDEFAPLRAALGFGAQPAGGAGRPPRARLLRARRKALQLCLVAVLALALLGGSVAYVFWDGAAASRSQPPVLAAATPAAAQPTDPTVPIAAFEQPQPTPPPPVETGELAGLHREFDAFVASSGRSMASLTPEQRDALVAEFLRRRAAQPAPETAAPETAAPETAAPATAAAQAAPAAPAIPSGPRVVVHVPEGMAAAETSAQVLAVLRAQVGEGQIGSVQVRHVKAAPRRPSVRYFRPEDAAAARAVMRQMTDLGLPWIVQDFTASPRRPSAGTVEVWLPREQ